MNIKEIKKAQLHTVKNLAVETDSSERHIRRGIAEGKIHIVRLGTSVRIPESERLRILQKGF